MADADFETLWNDLHVRLCRFICSRIPDGDDAEDILQDVFIRMHANLDRVREMDRLEAWVYQIARNSIIDYYRRRKQVVDLDEYPVEDEHLEEDAGESLAPYLREVVQGLPEPYREALMLTEYQGLSQKDLAEKLGMSFSGAKSRVQRAREKVRDTLMNCFHVEFDVRGTVIDVSPRCCCCCAE